MAEPAAPTPDIPCMNLTVAATGVYRFKVQGYSATKDVTAQADQHYESDAFSVGGYDWAVRYYPDRGGVYVSVTLVLLSDLKDAGQKVGVRFACALQDRHGELSPERCRSASHVFSGSEEWGFWNYTHDVLEDPDFIVGDCFTLVCSVSVLRKPVMRY